MGQGKSTERKGRSKGVSWKRRRSRSRKRNPSKDKSQLCKEGTGRKYGVVLEGGDTTPMNSPDGSQNNLNWLFENGEEKVRMDNRPHDNLENIHKNSGKPGDTGAMRGQSTGMENKEEFQDLTPSTNWGDKNGGELHDSLHVVPYIPSADAQKVYGNYAINNFEHDGNSKDGSESSVNSTLSSNFHSVEKEDEEMRSHINISTVDPQKVVYWGREARDTPTTVSTSPNERTVDEEVISAEDASEDFSQSFVEKTLRNTNVKTTPRSGAKVDTFMSRYPKEKNDIDIHVLSSETSSKSRGDTNSVQDDASASDDVYMPPVKTRLEKLNITDTDTGYSSSSLASSSSSVSSSSSSGSAGIRRGKSLKGKKSIVLPVRPRIEKSTIPHRVTQHYSSSSGSDSTGRRPERNLKSKQNDQDVQSVIDDFELEMKSFSNSIGSHVIGRKEPTMHTDDSLDSNQDDSIASTQDESLATEKNESNSLYSNTRSERERRKKDMQSYLSRRKETMVASHDKSKSSKASKLGKEKIQFPFFSVSGSIGGHTPKSGTPQHRQGLNTPETSVPSVLPRYRQEYEPTSKYSGSRKNIEKSGKTLQGRNLNTPKTVLSRNRHDNEFTTKYLSSTQGNKGNMEKSDKSLRRQDLNPPETSVASTLSSNRHDKEPTLTSHTRRAISVLSSHQDGLKGKYRSRSRSRTRSLNAEVTTEDIESTEKHIRSRIRVQTGDEGVKNKSIANTRGRSPSRTQMTDHTKKYAPKSNLRYTHNHDINTGESEGLSCVSSEDSDSNPHKWHMARNDKIRERSRGRERVTEYTSPLDISKQYSQRSDNAERANLESKETSDDLQAGRNHLKVPVYQTNRNREILDRSRALRRRSQSPSPLPITEESIQTKERTNGSRQYQQKTKSMNPSHSNDVLSEAENQEISDFQTNKNKEMLGRNRARRRRSQSPSPLPITEEPNQVKERRNSSPQYQHKIKSMNPSHCDDVLGAAENQEISDRAKNVLSRANRRSRRSASPSPFGRTDERSRTANSPSTGEVDERVKKSPSPFDRSDEPDKMDLRITSSESSSDSGGPTKHRMSRANRRRMKSPSPFGRPEEPIEVKQRQNILHKDQLQSTQKEAFVVPPPQAKDESNMRSLSRVNRRANHRRSVSPSPFGRTEEDVVPLTPLNHNNEKRGEPMYAPNEKNESTQRTSRANRRRSNSPSPFGRTMESSRKHTSNEQAILAPTSQDDRIMKPIHNQHTSYRRSNSKDIIERLKAKKKLAEEGLLKDVQEEADKKISPDQDPLRLVTPTGSREKNKRIPHLNTGRVRR